MFSRWNSHFNSLHYSATWKISSVPRIITGGIFCGIQIEASFTLSDCDGESDIANSWVMSSPIVLFTLADNKDHDHSVRIDPTCLVKLSCKRLIQIIIAIMFRYYFPVNWKHLRMQIRIWIWS